MKKVIYCFPQKSMCSRKGKEHQVESRGMDFNTSSPHRICELGHTTWSSVPQFPYLWIWTFTICLLLPTGMLQGAKSTMHAQVLCKIKSHWLLNIAYLLVHAQPCILTSKRSQGVDCRCQPLPLCLPGLCHQETSAFAYLTIKKIKVFHKSILITCCFPDIHYLQ